MLAKYTLLASTSFPQCGGFPFPLTAEEEYIFNTNNIRQVKVSGTTDSEFTYLFSPSDPRTSRAVFTVNEPYSTFVTNAAATEANKLIALTVIKDEDGEDVSSVTWYVNQDYIFLAYDYDTDKTKVWLCDGGYNYKTIEVVETLDEIITLADAT